MTKEDSLSLGPQFKSMKEDPLQRALKELSAANEELQTASRGAAAIQIPGPDPGHIIDALKLHGEVVYKAANLEAQAITNLVESSKRLESITKILIGLTILLTISTLILIYFTVLSFYGITPLHIGSLIGIMAQEFIYIVP